MEWHLSELLDYCEFEIWDLVLVVSSLSESLDCLYFVGLSDCLYFVGYPWLKSRVLWLGLKIFLRHYGGHKHPSGVLVVFLFFFRFTSFIRLLTILVISSQMKGVQTKKSKF